METPLSSSRFKDLRMQNTNPTSPSPSPSPSPLRLWRPAAQKNMRNQWSKLLASKNRWVSAASEARSHATSLVNNHLSQRYLPNMDLGVLRDMPSIRQKAAEKLGKEQDICRNKLLSSYKDMVISLAQMVQSSSSMRCFLKVSSSSSVVQFCNQPEDVNDPGDGGGISVFSSLSISNFESLAQELIEMFASELNIKRLLVVELLGVNCKEGGEQDNLLRWSQELYPGEFDDLRTSDMLLNDNNQPVPPRIKDWESDGYSLPDQPKVARSREVLQVYLTTWLADVNIDMNKMSDIFSTVEVEMQVKLS